MSEGQSATNKQHSNITLLQSQSGQHSHFGCFT